MGLLSGLLVQGARRGLSQGVSQALSGALSGAASQSISNYFSGGGGSGGGATPLREVVVQGNTPAAQPPVAPAVSNAVSQVIAGNVGNDNVAGGNNTVGEVTVEGEGPKDDGVDALGAPASAALANALSMPATTLDELTVQGTRPPALPTAERSDFQAPGFQSLINIGSPEITPPENITPAEEPQGIENIAMLAPLAALGLVGPGPTGNITPTGEGGGFLDNVDVKDLIAAGLLGAGLLNPPGGGGPGKDGLEQVAKNNMNLANRLGNIADAGMQGNIGGKGLNAIKRMVRKAQAAIRQRYAGMGMSGSTAETDDLNDAVEAGVQQQFEIGQKMAATGLNAIAALSGQSAQAYLALMNAQTAKDTALGNALANFAGAIAR